MEIKSIIILLSTLVFGNVFSQINTVSPKEPNFKDDNKIKYDSTENELKKDVHGYVGQSFYCSKFEFHNELNFNLYHETKSIDDYTNIFLNGKSYIDYDSEDPIYDSLIRKSLFVVSVLHHPDWLINEYNINTYYIGLWVESTHDTLYYEYHSHSDDVFPFIVNGYFEKLKKLQNGKTYTLKSLPTECYNKEHIYEVSGDTKLFDVFTGNEIKFVPYSEWKCIDLAINSLNKELCLVLENNLKQSILYPYILVENNYSGHIVK